MVNKKLLFSITKKDFEISYFSGSGSGGQHRNKHQNCIRLKHIDSDVMVVGQSHRSRQQNLREAFQNLINHPKFKMWHLRRTHEAIKGETLEKEIEKMMEPQNLKIEVREKGKWVDET